MTGSDKKNDLDLRELDLTTLDKDQLLEGIDELHFEEKGLGFKTVILGVMALITIVAIVFPKIYINSNIYRLSLEINTLYSNAKSLKEEQRFLAQKLEAVKYQQNIVNGLQQTQLQH